MQKVTDEELRREFSVIQKVVNFNDLPVLSLFVSYESDKSFNFFQKVDSFWGINYSNGEFKDFYSKKVLISYEEKM